MFVISVKSEKAKMLFASFLALVLLTIGGIVYVSADISMPVSRQGAFSMKAETPEERIAFFRQFGYEVNESPTEVKEVVVPTEFDEMYNEYNELQKKQGLDLTDYKGVRVKSWSYEILNYPGFENTSGQIRGNLLTYNGIVIACDISNIELDGFTEKLF